MESGAMDDAPNILVIGAEGTGKSSIIRLLLGKYSIGESKGFFLHNGLIGQNNRLAKILECPPKRQETIEEYTEGMQNAVRQFCAPVTSVIVVTKQNTVGGGGFQLNKERNIPLDELRAAYSIMGNKFKTSVFVVFTNWSRQFARVNDRLQRGMTEDSVMKKIHNEFQRNLGMSNVSCFFMDSVFWRNEQRSTSPGYLTTLQSSYSLAGAILKEPYDPVSNTSTPKTEPRLTNKKPPAAPKYRYSRDISDSSDSDSQPAQRLNQWKGRKHNNLANIKTDSNQSLNSKETPTTTIPIFNKVDLKILDDFDDKYRNNTQYEDGAQFSASRRVPIYQEGLSRRSSSSDSVGSFDYRRKKQEATAGVKVPLQVSTPVTKDTSFDRFQASGSTNKLELSDYVEAKVREMMDKEGVTLDFSDTKLKGRIVTKTRIIKEVIGKDGKTEIVEDEEIDESMFGPELESLADISNQSENTLKIQKDIINSSEPIYNLGSPVISSTFDRRNTYEMNGSHHSNQNNYSYTNAEESDASQVIVAEKTSYQRDNTATINTEENTTYISGLTTHNTDMTFAQDTRIYEESENESETCNIEISQAINEALDQNEIDEEVVDVDDLMPTTDSFEDFPSSICILGMEKNIQTMREIVEKKGASNIFCCPVSYRGGILQYHNLVQTLDVGREVVFVWTIETETGEIDDQLISVFKDFLKVFPSEAIQSMMVVLWYPGSMEDLQESIEDLTEIVRTNYQYKSSLGFPVLQFKTDEQFMSSLTKNIHNIQPFIVKDIVHPQKPIYKLKEHNRIGQESQVLSSQNSFSQEIQVVSTEEIEHSTSPKDSRVDDPVILVVGPPGHGKSSVGNLILGGDHFQLRGVNVMSGDSVKVCSGNLQRDYSFATVLESPGIYADEPNNEGRGKIEEELRKIGFITHMVLVWHALELRLTDLDYVLKEIQRIFGRDILPHLIFAVTFCDSGSKAKKYRSKRGISFDSLASMLNQKVQEVFRTQEEALVYFLSAKSPRDTSRKQLVKYLSSENWSPYNVSRMEKWVQSGTTEVDHKETVEDTYEDVEEEVYYEDKTLETPSKSLHNLSVQNYSSNGNLLSTKNNSQIGGSLYSVQTTNNQSVGRGRQAPRGRGNMFKSGIGAKRGSTSSSNLGLNSRPGRGRSQNNMLNMGSRSRSKSQSKLYQSQANIGMTRSNLALQESRSRSNLYEESPVKGSGGNEATGNYESTQRGRANTRPRLFSGSSARSASKSRPQPRSKSRENIRQQRPKPRQSSSLPRQVGQRNQRPQMRRSRSTWSLKSANYKKRPNAGECSIL